MDTKSLVRQIHAEALRYYAEQGISVSLDREPRTIHYTELTPATPGSVLEVEWETYRREVARLLAEGHEGKYVLIIDDQIIGIWEDRLQALEVGYEHRIRGPFLIRQVLTRERVYHTGFRVQCPT